MERVVVKETGLRQFLKVVALRPAVTNDLLSKFTCVAYRSSADILVNLVTDNPLYSCDVDWRPLPNNNERSLCNEGIF